MKRVDEKRTIVDTLIYYDAVDGTRFTSEEECKKYEESARGVLSGRFTKLIVGSCNEWELLRGDDNNEVVAIKLNSREDADTVLQLYYLDNPYLLREDQDDTYKKYRERYENLVAQALEDNDILLMGKNYEGDLYFLDTKSAILDRLNNIGKEKE